MKKLPLSIIIVFGFSILGSLSHLFAMETTDSMSLHPLTQAINEIKTQDSDLEINKEKIVEAIFYTKLDYQKKYPHAKMSDVDKFVAGRLGKKLKKTPRLLPILNIIIEEARAEQTSIESESHPLTRAINEVKAIIQENKTFTDESSLQIKEIITQAIFETKIKFEETNKDCSLNDFTLFLNNRLAKRLTKHQEIAPFFTMVLTELNIPKYEEQEDETHNFIKQTIETLIENPHFMNERMGIAFDEFQDLIIQTIENEKKISSKTSETFLPFIEKKIQKTLGSFKSITPSQRQRIHIFFDVFLEKDEMKSLILEANSLNNSHYQEKALSLILEKMEDWNDRLYQEDYISISQESNFLFFFFLLKDHCFKILGVEKTSKIDKLFDKAFSSFMGLSTKHQEEIPHHHLTRSSSSSSYFDGLDLMEKSWREYLCETLVAIPVYSAFGYAAYWTYQNYLTTQPQ